MNLSKAKPATVNRGFTLIELLFVIAIISVLAVMSLGIMKGAQDDAKEAATLSRIRQVESMLQIELEDYEVRRLPIALSSLASAAFANPLYGDGNGDGVPDNLAVQVRNLKRRILQDIINAEIPRPLIRESGGVPVRDSEGNLQFDYNDDLGVFPTTKIPGTDPTAVGFTTWLNNNYPGLRAALNSVTPSRVRSWDRFKSNLITNGTTAEFNLPGEYLYQTLARMSFDGAPAIEVLGNQAIGDSDDDGFLEVVDAWGDPLQLRIWQLDANEVDSSDVPLSPQNPNPTTDIWRDVVGADFDFKDGDGVPTGYSVIDSTVPREIGKIRFEVVSTRLVY